MHYVVFLMDHGRAPYRDIVEMNMPGTYMLDWLIVHTVGGGPFGWWLWDTASGIVAIAGCLWIAGPGRRAAGATAGALAYLIHLADGPKEFGQRDWIVAVSLALAMGCLFTALRRDRPQWMAGFMGLCVFAAAIKPPVIAIGFLFLAAACWMVSKRRIAEAPQRSVAAVRSLLLWSFVGALVPAAMVAVFLLRWGVVREFVAILRGLVPWYGSLDRLSLLHLARRAPNQQLIPLLLGALAIFILCRSWRRWESAFLCAAMLSGTLLFFVQGKGWPYHRYPEMIFAALWGLLELDRGLRGGKSVRIIATATLAATMIVVTPLLVRSIYAWSGTLGNVPYLEADLNALGGPALSGKIQCLDMTEAACIDVLYRMNLLQSTGYIYDFYFFPARANHVTIPLQKRFLEEVTLRPPQVIVLSADTWPGNYNSYQQVDRWPAFREFLERNYQLYREQSSDPPHPGSGYKLYVRETPADQATAR